MIPAMLLTVAAVKADPALARGAKCGRRVFVTEIWPTREEPAADVQWTATGPGGKCPVVESSDIEVSTFTEGAAQDRHFHKRATEIYLVLEGELEIEVAGNLYKLGVGDMIVINPGVPHCVQPTQGPLLCRVVACNCGGETDKVPAPFLGYEHA